MGQQATYTPPPVKGYRSLTQAEVDLMNKGKELGQQMQSYVDEVAAHLSLQYAGCIVGENEEPPTRSSPSWRAWRRPSRSAGSQSAAPTCSAASWQRSGPLRNREHFDFNLTEKRSWEPN